MSISYLQFDVLVHNELLEAQILILVTAQINLLRICSQEHFIISLGELRFAGSSSDDRKTDYTSLWSTLNWETFSLQEIPCNWDNIVVLLLRTSGDGHSRPPLSTKQQPVYGAWRRARCTMGQFKRLPDFIIVLFFSFVGKRIYPKILHLFRDSTLFKQVMYIHPNI